MVELEQERHLLGHNGFKDTPNLCALLRPLVEFVRFISVNIRQALVRSQRSQSQREANEGFCRFTYGFSLIEKWSVGLSTAVTGLLHV